MVDFYDGRAQLYPPLTTFMLKAMAQVELTLPLAWRENSRALNGLLKFPATVADTLTAFALAMAVWARPRVAVLCAALYIFHPAIFYVCVFWGQLDSVYTALLVCGLVALQKKKWVGAWLAAAAALGSKVQAVACLPVLMADTLRRGGIRAAVGGVIVFVGVLILLTVPWWWTGRLDSQFFDSVFLSSRTPRAVVSGYNLWYLILDERAHTTSSLAQIPLLGLSVRTLGMLGYGAYTSFIAFGLWQNRARDSVLGAALTSFGLFMLPTEVHERFLFPVIALLMLAWASSVVQSDRARTRVYAIVLGVLSLTFSFNLLTIAQPYFIASLNLVAQPIDSVWVWILKFLAQSAALVNLLPFGGLTVLFWKGTNRHDARI